MDTSTSPWTTLSRKVAYENPWIEVTHCEVLDPSGRAGVYGVMSPRNIALGVLPLHSDATVTIVGQYRFPLNRYSWEIPEGGGTKGVEPLQSIQRELQEESGLAADKWHKIIDGASLSNSISDEIAHTWIAWDLHEGASELESTEADLVAKRIPYADLVSMVWSGEVHDSLTIMTVAKVEAMRLRRELPDPVLAILANVG